MGTGCARSLDRFADIVSYLPYYNKVNLDNWNCFSLMAIACVSSFCISWFAQDLAAQSSNPARVSPTRYTVSASELRVPPKAWSHLEAAHKEFARGNMEKAEHEVERALQVDPACGPAFSMRAFIRLAEKNSSAALGDATRATSIDAYDGDAFVALAMAYNSLKDYENAMTASTEALALQPESWQAHLEMAKSLYGRGHYDSALRVLNVLANDFPDVHLVRGNVLMNLARRDEAVEEFRLFLREAPFDPRSEQVRQICSSNASGGAMESASTHR